MDDLLKINVPSEGFDSLMDFVNNYELTLKSYSTEQDIIKDLIVRNFPEKYDISKIPLMYQNILNTSDKIIAMDDNGIKIWDIESKKIYQTIKYPKITCFCMSANNDKIITGDAYGYIKIWNVCSGKMIYQTEEQNDGIVSICATNDNQKIISIG